MKKWKQTDSDRFSFWTFASCNRLIIPSNEFHRAAPYCCLPAIAMTLFIFSYFMRIYSLRRAYTSNECLYTFHIVRAMHKFIESYKKYSKELNWKQSSAYSFHYFFSSFVVPKFNHSIIPLPLIQFVLWKKLIRPE